MITTRTDGFTCSLRHGEETHKDIHPDQKQIFVQILISAPSSNRTRDRREATPRTATPARLSGEVTHPELVVERARGERGGARRRHAESARAASAAARGDATPKSQPQNSLVASAAVRRGHSPGTRGRARARRARRRAATPRRSPSRRTAWWPARLSGEVTHPELVVERARGERGGARRRHAESARAASAAARGDATPKSQPQNSLVASAAVRRGHSPGTRGRARARRARRRAATPRRSPSRRTAWWPVRLSGEVTHPELVVERARGERGGARRRHAESARAASAAARGDATPKSQPQNSLVASAAVRRGHSPGTRGRARARRARRRAATPRRSPSRRTAWWPARLSGEVTHPELVVERARGERGGARRRHAESARAASAAARGDATPKSQPQNSLVASAAVRRGHSPGTRGRARARRARRRAATPRRSPSRRTAWWPARLSGEVTHPELVVERARGERGGARRRHAESARAASAAARGDATPKSQPQNSLVASAAVRRGHSPGTRGRARARRARRRAATPRRSPSRRTAWWPARLSGEVTHPELVVERARGERGGARRRHAESARAASAAARGDATPKSQPQNSLVASAAVRRGHSPGTRGRARARRARRRAATPRRSPSRRTAWWPARLSGEVTHPELVVERARGERGGARRRHAESARAASAAARGDATPKSQPQNSLVASAAVRRGHSPGTRGRARARRARRRAATPRRSPSRRTAWWPARLSGEVTHPELVVERARGERGGARRRHAESARAASAAARGDATPKSQPQNSLVASAAVRRGHSPGTRGRARARRARRRAATPRRSPSRRTAWWPARLSGEVTHPELVVERARGERGGARRRHAESARAASAAARGDATPKSQPQNSLVASAAVRRGHSPGTRGRARARRARRRAATPRRSPSRRTAWWPARLSGEVTHPELVVERARGERGGARRRHAEVPAAEQLGGQRGCQARSLTRNSW
ncbi:unnamed protein product [Euphydryas editha]|uniref:Uncharacterized protein n=1 Tax=Euphydryas editha TaxID=104508 RepID=A0AAU9V431_EUPED|nr:unnamed protein product [Euphydryas editha]